jgi:hypothetical protein
MEHQRSALRRRNSNGRLTNASYSLPGRWIFMQGFSTCRH